MAQLPKSRLGAIYVDFHDLAKAIFRDSGLDPDQLEQIQLYSGMGISLACTNSGVRLDYVLACDPGKTSNSAHKSKISSSLAGTLDITPSDVVAYMGVADIKTALEEFNRNLTRLSDEEDFFGEIEDEMDVDLEDDVFSWMRGEVAFAVVPDNTTFLGSSNDTNMGLYAIIGVSDAEKARSKVEMIVNRLIEDPAVFWERDVEVINGEEVRLVRDLYYEGNVVFGYVLRGDYLIIGSSLETLKTALNTSEEPLANSEAFRKAVGKKTDYATCMFVDVGRLVALLQNSMSEAEQQKFEEDVYPFLKPVKSISLTTEKEHPD